MPPLPAPVRPVSVAAIPQPPPRVDDTEDYGEGLSAAQRGGSYFARLYLILFNLYQAAANVVVIVSNHDSFLETGILVALIVLSGLACIAVALLNRHLFGIYACAALFGCLICAFLLVMQKQTSFSATEMPNWMLIVGTCGNFLCVFWALLTRYFVGVKDRTTRAVDRRRRIAVMQSVPPTQRSSFPVASLVCAQPREKAAPLPEPTTSPAGERRGEVATNGLRNGTVDAVLPPDDEASREEGMTRESTMDLSRCQEVSGEFASSSTGIVANHAESPIVDAIPLVGVEQQRDGGMAEPQQSASLTGSPMKVERTASPTSDPVETEDRGSENGAPTATTEEV